MRALVRVRVSCTYVHECVHVLYVRVRRDVCISNSADGCCISYCMQIFVDVCINNRPLGFLTLPACTTGRTPDSAYLEAKHQQIKRMAKSSSGRDTIGHVMRRVNTDYGLQSCADGDSWTALQYMPEFHAWEERQVTAGAAFLDLCKQFPALLPSAAYDAGRPSTYTGSKWTVPIRANSRQCSSANIQPKVLLKAYRLWYAAAAQDWHVIMHDTATAYTHHSADRRSSSGLGRFRSAKHSTHEEVPLRYTAAHEIQSTAAEDVMLQVVPKAAARRQGQTLTAPARLAFFFKHKPNQPLPVESMSVDDAGLVRWVAVQQFVQHTAGPRREHVRDDASGEYVFTLRDSLEYYPAANIKGHVHMPHWCFFSGGKTQACHRKTGGGIQHVARDAQERYLYNDHAHYREEDAPLV